MKSTRFEPSDETMAAAEASRPGVLMLTLQPRIVRSALKVSLVVGTVLNLVNNGEQWWTSHEVNLWHIAMNFVVPYCVSSYSAAKNEAQREKGR
jgi:hypothetical protein